MGVVNDSSIGAVRCNKSGHKHNTARIFCEETSKSSQLHAKNPCATHYKKDARRVTLHVLDIARVSRVVKSDKDEKGVSFSRKRAMRRRRAVMEGRSIASGTH